MASVMRMPASLAGVTEAAIQAWLASPGQTVALGDPLVEIETEKAVFEYGAEAAGTIGALLAEPGAAIAVGDPIAVILEDGEGADVLDAVLAASGSAPSSVSDAAAVDTPTREAEPGPEPEASVPAARIFASPIVRRIARERGVPLESLHGTGPGGRIVRRDLERADAPAESIPAEASAPDASLPSTVQTSATRPLAAWTDVPLTGMRRAIARRLTESATTVPHFTVTAHCRMDALLALRRELNAIATHPISVNDFIVAAVARAQRAVPAANAVWNGDSIRTFAGVDVAIAVAIEGGLLTPVLRGVHLLSLIEIAGASRDLADRARAGRLRQEELEGGSFTVSNLGMLGVEQFTAIINPPHAGILAVGAATKRAVVVDDELVAATVMTVTLSADHRVLDGAVASEWIAAFTQFVEHPLGLLI